MSESESAGAAFDASTNVSDQRGDVDRDAKLASSVEFLQRQVTQSEDTVRRLEEKVEKLRGHLEGAEQAVEDAREEQDRLNDELATARDGLGEVRG